MICKKCKKEGKESHVYPGVGMTTLMYCAPYYDNDGKYHIHDRNRTTTDFTCSNGHKWTEQLPLLPCPTCGDSWQKDNQEK